MAAYPVNTMDSSPPVGEARSRPGERNKHERRRRRPHGYEKRSHNPQSNGLQRKSLGMGAHSYLALVYGTDTRTCGIV